MSTTKKRSMSVGQRIVLGLQEVVETMEAGGMEAVAKKFTVRKAPSPGFSKPSLNAKQVIAIRNTLAVSQTTFAALLGVSTNTVRAWEQGINPPSGMAVRFLDEVRRNPEYWKTRVLEVCSEV